MTHNPEQCDHTLDGKSAWTGYEPAVRLANSPGVFRRQCRVCYLIEEFAPKRVLCDNDCTFC